MALFIARHGQTDWNLAGRFQSRSDIPLNETGVQQALALQRKLTARAIKFNAVFSSPLSRAIDTATIVVDGMATAVQPRDELLELSLGDFEGQYENDLILRDGSAFGAWRQQLFQQAAPHGESIADGVRRVQPLLQEVTGNCLRSDVLIVAHQAINIALKIALSGVNDLEHRQRYKQANNVVEIWDVESPSLLETIVV